MTSVPQCSRSPTAPVVSVPSVCLADSDWSYYISALGYRDSGGVWGKSIHLLLAALVNCNWHSVLLLWTLREQWRWLGRGVEFFQVPYCKHECEALSLLMTSENLPSVHHSHPDEPTYYTSDLGKYSSQSRLGTDWTSIIQELQTFLLPTSRCKCEKPCLTFHGKSTHRHAKLHSKFPSVGV